MKKLLVYLKDYVKESILGPVFKLVEVIFELMVPLVMASLIDEGIANNDQTHILKMFGLLVVFGLLGLAASISAQYFAAKAATGFAKKLNRETCQAPGHRVAKSWTQLKRLSMHALFCLL